MGLIIERVHDKSEWQMVLGHYLSYDFSHTYDFHYVSQHNGEGVPVLFVAKDSIGKHIACWPLLERSIPGSDLVDYSSVYAYGGPLFNSLIKRVEAIQAILLNMSKSGGVSIFSRMHPLWVEEIEDEKLRGQKLGDVVVVDVQKNKDEFMSSYRSGHRYEIRKAQKAGLETLIDSRLVDITPFVNIYRQSMIDIGASSYYMFSLEYFKNLIGVSDFRVFIIYATFNKINVAAAMFFVTNDVMQYYLSGTVDAYKKYAPSKLILAAAHRLAIDLDLKYLVLGGGVGSQQDALFDFKRGFSDCLFPYYVFKNVLDPLNYKELCISKGVDPDKEFFPAYRSI